MNNKEILQGILERNPELLKEKVLNLIDDYIKYSRYNSWYADEIYDDLKLFINNKIWISKNI